MNHKIIEIKNKDFPKKLQIIKNSPSKIYAIGNKNLLYEDCFAIVGTRKISDYGIKNCKFFTRELALRNIPIVSGMALGTDTIAHKATLECEGNTIAVLGSGFKNIFPKENIKLFHEIIENNGLIITEFEENIPPLRYNFPKRNRIITAISEGVLVVEAACKSGTSITVNNAKEQGKKVFALPGKLDSSVGIGVNNLIKKGAILTTNIEDILINYPQFMDRKRITYKKKSIYIKLEYLEIYNCIKDTGKYIDELLIEKKKEFKDIIVTITNMELEGIIYKDIDGRYILKNSF